MDKAMMEIIEVKDFEFITVKEICDKANVNRSTFYLHYENTKDLLSESIKYMNDQFLEYFPKQYETIAEKLKNGKKEELNFISPKYIMPYLMYIKENKRLFRTALSNAVSMNLDDTYKKMFKHIFSPAMDMYSISNEEKTYIAAFYINGMIAVVKEWLQNDCKMSEEHICDIILKCVNTSN